MSCTYGFDNKSVSTFTRDLVSKGWPAFFSKSSSTCPDINYGCVLTD